MNTSLDLYGHALRLAECHLEVREMDAEKRIIRGFASTPAIDKYEDIVDVGAFKRTMTDFMRNGSILGHHNPRAPLGKPTDYELSEKGLWIEAALATGIHPLDHKEQLWNEITQGILKGLSIGFRILKDESIDPNSDEGKRGARRRIALLRLFEISVVTIPAGEGTWFSLAKGLQYGSDAPIDLYHRGLWPDDTCPIDRAKALDLYWAGRWPGLSVTELRSLAAGGNPEGEPNNEGVVLDEASADHVVNLRTAVALLRAR